MAGDPIDPDNPPQTGKKALRPAHERYLQSIARFRATSEARRLAFSNLNDPTHNRAFAARSLPLQVEIFEQTPEYRIVRTGDDQGGWIILHNAFLETADYVIEHSMRGWFGVRVAECLFWHDAASPYASGLTDRMFDILLARYPIIMSDPFQPNAHEFWPARMADAVQRECRIGVVNRCQPRINWFDPTLHGDHRDWLVAQGAYDPSATSNTIRYIIAR